MHIIIKLFCLTCCQVPRSSRSHNTRLRICHLVRPFTFTFHFHALEKEMATHSSVLAWRIPGTWDPGGLPSMGSHRVRHDWIDLAAAAAASVRPYKITTPLFLSGLLRFCQGVFLSYFSKSSKVSLACSVGFFDTVLLKPKVDKSYKHKNQ